VGVAGEEWSIRSKYDAGAASELRPSIFSARCARCGFGLLQRSRRRNLAEWIVAAILAPYRCLRCFERSLKWRLLSIDTD
jgi:hypothetical protein